MMPLGGWCVITHEKHLHRHLTWGKIINEWHLKAPLYGNKQTTVICGQMFSVEMTFWSKPSNLTCALISDLSKITNTGIVFVALWDHPELASSHCVSMWNNPSSVFGLLQKQYMHGFHWQLVSFKHEHGMATVCKVYICKLNGHAAHVCMYCMCAL